MRRAYFFEEPTGRSQWEPPTGGPPPEADSYYRGPGGPGGPPGIPSRSPGPGPSPGPYGYGDPSPAPGEDPEQRKKNDKKKYLAAGAAGLALGAAGGALIAHEMGMSSLTPAPFFALCCFSFGFVC